MTDNSCNRTQDEIYEGLRQACLEKLGTREYTDSPTSLVAKGLPIVQLAGLEERPDGWIPGVEIVPRKVFKQRQRGCFGEFARKDEGICAQIGFWPSQWAAATMFSGTAKGFHIHPPFIPEGEEAGEWFQKLFVEEPENYELRPYDKEQWDFMFFPSGAAEMILVDERKGMDRHVMRFFIEGDDRCQGNTAGVIIPAGVAHAIRCEGSSDLMMVYGTSTSFTPSFEGRIASGVEVCEFSDEWKNYIEGQ